MHKKLHKARPFTSARSAAQTFSAISALALLPLLAAFGTAAQAQITFYESDDYRGRAFTTNQPVNNLGSYGFNDRASSVVVTSGRWEVCDNSNFGGECVVLRSGNYPSLRAMGLNDQVSSTRRANARRIAALNSPAPLAGTPDYAWRRRPNEAIFSARVTGVRAVVGAPSERCWIERQQVERNNDNNSTGRTLLGAVLGGVIGHQIGGGTGRDIATVGGAVAGGVLGNRSAQGSSEVVQQDVRRCSSVASTIPAYWDVDYEFRGRQHRVQMASEPGATISVNGNGEPRQ